MIDVCLLTAHNTRVLLEPDMSFSHRSPRSESKMRFGCSVEYIDTISGQQWLWQELFVQTPCKDCSYDDSFEASELEHLKPPVCCFQRKFFQTCLMLKNKYTQRRRFNLAKSTWWLDMWVRNWVRLHSGFLWSGAACCLPVIYRAKKEHNEWVGSEGGYLLAVS